MPYSANIKAISLRALNRVMLSLSLLFFLATLYITFLIWKEYNNFVVVIENYINWERAAHQVHTGSDYLTEQARLFTQTGQKKYADKYFQELRAVKNGQGAQDFLAKHHLGPEHSENLQRAINLSRDLTTQEIHAMRLAAEGFGSDLSDFPDEIRQTPLSAADQKLTPEAKRERGKALLFGERYLNSKKGIMGSLSEVLNENLSRTNSEQLEQGRKFSDLLQTQRILLGALCVLNILIFAMVILLVVKPLQSYLRSIRENKMLTVMGAYEFRHLALTYNNIFAIKERHDKMLQYKAEHDPLTGLLNRTAFDSLDTLLADTSTPVALILADVDKFKEINDNYGHETGDEALKKVAELLRHSFRSDDFAIRLGGDEFAVVVMGNFHDFKKVILDKINFINETLQHPAGGLPALSISAGVAVSAEGFSEILYRNADVALYKVKEGGRRGCKFYDGEADEC